MIDTRIAPSAHPTNPPVIQPGTFDPATWLERYTALGGVYTATDSELNLCILVNSQSDEVLSQVRQMIADLSDEQRAAILAYLSGPGAPKSPTWQEVVARYEADRDAFSAHPYGRTSPTDPAYPALSREADALTEASEASLRKLIATPAPNQAALRRKIEIAAAEYGDGCDALRHVRADLDRLTLTRRDDSAILGAWQRRVEAFERYNLLPFSEQPGEPYTPEESAEWAIIDAAEETLRGAIATTPAGVAAQLWIALSHTLSKQTEEAATLNRDLAAFDAIDEELDWSARMMLAALRSLKAMEA